MPEGDPILDLRDVRFRWSGRSPFALSISNLSINREETVLLLGESGSGKSTLLSLICGALMADAGQVVVNGEDLATISAGRRDRFRAEHIGVIFQQFNLLPFGTVLDNIRLPLRFAPERRARVGDERAEARRLCAALGLPDIAAEKASALSVGQQQRVSVARALIGGPPIILADEPTSALDEMSQSAFLDLLFAQMRAHASTLLMVSHDPRLGARFDRVIKMEEIAEIERRSA